MIPLAEDVAERVGILGFVKVPERVLADEEELPVFAARRGLRAVEKRVADGDVDRKVGRVGKAREARRPQCRDEEAEARNCGGVGVEVDAVDRVERRLRRLCRGKAGTVRLPEGEEPREGAEEEVAAAAGGVDEADLFGADLLEGGGERPVEEELFHELGRLEEGVALAGGLGEVLIEVAEKAGRPCGVGEVVEEVAGLVALLPELAEEARAVGGKSKREGRVVLRVEEVRGAGELADLAEEGEEDVAVGVGGEGADVIGVAVLGEALKLGGRALEEARGPGALVEEAVVLEEADVDAGEDPGDPRLRDRLLAPRLVGHGRAPGGAGPVVLGLQVPGGGGVVVGAVAEVVLETGEELAEIGEEARGIDHRQSHCRRDPGHRRRGDTAETRRSSRQAGPDRWQMWDSSQKTKASREREPAASDRNTCSCSGTSALISKPFRTRKVSRAAWPARLLPSSKGWLRTSEKARAAPFSARLGYRSAPSKDACG